MHNLLILSKHESQYRTLFEHAHLQDLTIAQSPSPSVDIVFGEPDLIKDALPSLPALAWVQSNWAGVEPLLESDTRRDYLLTNARGVFGGLMSEYVLAYLLAHERRVFERAFAQKVKRWENSLTGSLRGKTIGLIGVGSIGAEIARTAKFFNMTVRGYTRASETCPHVDAYFHPHSTPLSEKGPGCSILEFASGLDYLVSILPNTEETREMVNSDLLEALAAHVLFINVGRGLTVDEHALTEALNRNRIAGAVLDVLEHEPLPDDHPFWETKNLHLTFHTSAPSLPEDISRLFIENYLLYSSGKTLKYLVDFERGY